MKAKLDIQWFIEQEWSNGWEQKLQEKPYCITITRDHVLGKNLIMFKYSQIDSDFKIGLVRDCRGIIFDEDTWKPVCVPFFKFGNAGEGWVKDIDWASAKVTEKLDGSLTKVVKIGNELLWSTNGTIDAAKANLPEQIGCPAKTFKDLMLIALGNAGYTEDQFKDMLEEGYTYMFELTSPWNRVVVPHKETRLNFIGVRNNDTFEETFFMDHPLAKKFNTPKVYDLKSLDDCIAATKDLPWDDEGYVALDKNFNRLKIKSVAYVSVHHLRGDNGVMSYRRAIELVRKNEIEEVCAYFEDFRKPLNECKDRFWKTVADTKKAVEGLNAWLDANGYLKRPWLVETGGQNRKDAAIWIMKNFPISGLGFGILDHKVESVDKWFMEMPTDKLAKMLGYKE